MVLPFTHFNLPNRGSRCWLSASVPVSHLEKWQCRDAWWSLGIMEISWRIFPFDFRSRLELCTLYLSMWKPQRFKLGDWAAHNPWLTICSQTSACVYRLARYVCSSSVLHEMHMFFCFHSISEKRWPHSYLTHRICLINLPCYSSIIDCAPLSDFPVVYRHTVWRRTVGVR
jgi:hypothetical protein